MALDRLTKVDGGGISTTSDYRVGIITATKFVGPIEGDVTGSITATDGTFSGNVTIGGTLTYEDVTNIDSVGIITARDGIHVGAGVSAVGVGTFSGVDITGGTLEKSSTGNKLIFNSSTETRFTHSSGSKVLLSFYQTNGFQGSLDVHAGAIVLNNGGNKTSAVFRNQGAVELYYDNAGTSTKRFETSNTGASVFGTLVATGADINGDLDVDGHTNLDNVSIAGVTTCSDQLNMLDNKIIRLGSAAASRTSIYYDSSGSNTWIKNFNDTLKIGYRPVEIYYVNQKRLEFINGGNRFTTDVTTTFLGDNYHASWSPSSNKFQLNDNAKLAFGSQADTNIFHNNSHLYIQNTTGNIDVTGNVELNNDLDVDGHTNLDNVNIAGITTITKGLVMTAGASNLYQINGALSYYAADNAVYLNGAGNSGSLRLNATGSSNNRTSINLTGQSNSQADATIFNNASSESLRITSDGFIGINQNTPYNGLAIGKEGDHWDTNGNTYAHPEGRVLSSWLGDRNDNTDYWVGFVGKYLKPSATVNILLQPHVGNFNNQAGMYIAGEATGNFSSDFTIGKIMSGNVAGRGTTASSGKRATKSELLRITSNGVIGINDNNPGTGKKVKVVVDNNSSYQMAVNLTNNLNADCNFYIKTNESLIAPSTNTPLCLGTGGAEKVRIDSNGISGTIKNNYTLVAFIRDRDDGSRTTTSNSYQDDTGLVKNNAITYQQGDIIYARALCPAAIALTATDTANYAGVHIRLKITPSSGTTTYSNNTVGWYRNDGRATKETQQLTVTDHHINYDETPFSSGVTLSFQVQYKRDGGSVGSLGATGLSVWAGERILEVWQYRKAL